MFDVIKVGKGLRFSLLANKKLVLGMLFFGLIYCPISLINHLNFRTSFPMSEGAYDQMVKELLGSQSWTVLVNNESVILLKKKIL